jgi:hypothetical protein
MNFAASRDIIQNTPFPYNSMDRLRLAQQMTMAPQVSQEVQGQGGLAGLPVVQAGFGGFLRKIAPIALAIAAPYALPAIAPGIFGAGAALGAGTALGTGAMVGIGSGLGSLIAGAKPKDALKTALLSGVTAGAMKGASNYFAGKTAGTEGLSGYDNLQLTGADGQPLTTSESLINVGQSGGGDGFSSSLDPNPMKSYTPTIGLEDIQPEYGGPIKALQPDYSSSFDAFKTPYSVTDANIDAGISNLDAFTKSQPKIVETAYTDYVVPREFTARISPDQNIPFIDTKGTYAAGGDFELFKYPSLKGPGTGLPTVQEAMKIKPELNPLQQFVSDVKANPLGMLGKAAAIDITQPDFERMYAMEEYNKNTQDLLAQTGATISPSSFGTKRVVKIGQNQIPFNTEEQLQLILKQSLGQAPRPRMLANVTYQDVNTAAEGGLITAARGGMFAAPGEFSGMVPGEGGGQDDNVFMPIVENGQQKATLAVSPSEYVVDSYTMAALGDGNPAEGAKVMDQVVEEVREEAYGTTKQPNATKGLSTLRSLMT